MKRYTVNLAIRVWIERDIRAASREEAEARALARAKCHMNSEGFTWLDGKIEVLGSMDCSLLDKIPS